MVIATVDEIAALDKLESQWRKQGYKLIREPTKGELPEFLRGVRPDAIAVGQRPSIAIELLRTRKRASETKIRQLSSLFEGRDDWRLEVIYLTSEGSPLQAIRGHEIADSIGISKSLLESEPRAALLLGWSTLEATARVLEPDTGSRSLSSGSLVDLLVSYGHVSQSDGDWLRRLGRLRNSLAHGQLDLVPEEHDVRQLLELLSSLSLQIGDGLPHSA